MPFAHALVLLAHAFYMPAAGGGPENAYAWPLDLPRAITSSFCEYRAGRFHAGIDLRTGGIGKEVRAPADGYISRVRCSPTGYGKAVYLRLEDGNTVVFGHLDDFQAPLRAYVQHAQHAARSYTVNLYPEADAFVVKRGEAIAFSGQTGIGVPHLHYEIRDPQERPFNPRLLGITWPDTTLPVIRKLLVAPADPGSSVNGDIAPLVRDVCTTSPGHYTCAPIRAFGRIGFGLDVIDPANNGENVLGIRTLRTLCRGKEVFCIKNDRISYSRIRNGAVAFHPFLLDKGRFLLQWRWPGNVCEIYGQTQSDGWLDVPPEPVEVRLEAEDFLGNKATLTVPLRPDTQPPPAVPDRGETGRGAVELTCAGAWLVVTATFTAPEQESPILEIDGIVPTKGGAFRRVNDTTFRAGVLPSSSADALTLRVLHDRIASYTRRICVFQRGAGDRTETVGVITITVNSHSPYGALFMRAFPTLPTAPPPIPLRGKAYRIWPAASPIDAPVEIAFPIPGDVAELSRVHMYRETESGWRLVPTRRSKDRLVIASSHFGAFAALEDDVPPIISDVVIEKDLKRPAIRATISDVGSGIAGITVTCNGQWLLMEYDPERDLIEWERDHDLPEGPKELVFTISDAADNAATATRKTAL